MEITNSNYSFQDSFNNYLEEQVEKNLSTLIPPGFRSLQCPSGFNYMTHDGINYNVLTLKCIDSLYAVDKTTNTPYIKDDRFSTHYYNVLQSSAYTLSQASDKKISDGLIKYQGQAATVIMEYNKSGLPKLDSTTQEAAIVEIYTNCCEKFNGEVDVDCSIIPDRYFAFKLALQILNNDLGDGLQLATLTASKKALLKAAIKNIGSPTKASEGLPIGDSTAKYYPGYDKIPLSNALIGSLNSTENSMTIKMSGERFESDKVMIHMENESTFTIPILSLLDVTVDHKSTFDMNSLKTDAMQFSTEITYNGLTAVGVNPSALSPTGTTGWFAETTILDELKRKTGKDVDGFKLIGTQYKVDDIFGGSLAYLKTMLVSKVPTVKITFSHINMKYARSYFATENSVNVKLFGFIDLGGHSNSYKTENVSFSEDNQSVTITFSAPQVSGTLPAEVQTAHIMGGVPYYPGM